MKQNMGNLDRVIRILAALVVVVLYLTHQISGTLAVVALIVSAVFVLTAFVGYCPLYTPFGISSRHKE